MFTALQAANHQVSVYVPATSILPIVASYFGKDKLEVGDTLSKNNLTVEILPFLSQVAYDGLLRDCDINFVRGEDSWVRAIWAGKPFIWQPYFQDENTHIKKLNAFLALFYTSFDTKQVPCKAHECWSAGHMPKHVWTDYLKHLPAISSYTLLQSKQLAKQQDLAAKLAIFCNKL